MTGPCPAGCGRTQRAGMFLCSTCWREVPKHLQDDVYRTWRAYRSRKPGTTLLARQDIIRAYRQAREAALAAIA